MRDGYERAVELAEDHDGVLSRQLLRSIGIDSDRVRNQTRAGRWRTHGRQTVAMHTGDLSDVALRWRAVWEVGAGIAVIDGVSALQSAGMTGFDEDAIHVSALHRHTVNRSVPGVRVHTVRHRPEGHVLCNGLPRTRPEVAAIRAAHWAVSDRQAALVLLLTVQQRIIAPARLKTAAEQVRGRTRRAHVQQTITDICDGAHSLGELDLGSMCRSRGLPAPSRQVVRQGPRGRIYLDARWEADPVAGRRALVLEIDGAGHRSGLNLTEDNLRANALVIDGERVLRIDLIGLRLETVTFLDQLEAALRS